MNDVAICGFGPTGAFLALLLARAGVRVVVLETSDGEQLSPRAVALDDAVIRSVVQTAGMRDRFEATAERCPNMQMVSAWTKDSVAPPVVLIGDKTPPGKPGSWAQYSDTTLKMGPNGMKTGALAMWQPQLERDVRARLATHANCTVLFKHRVAAVERTAAGNVAVRVHRVEGTWRRTEGLEWIYDITRSIEPALLVQARFLVGCDGARSTVRSLCFQASSLVSLGYDRPWVAVDLALPRPRAVLGKALPTFNHHVFAERQFIIISGTGRSDALDGKHLRVDFNILPGDPPPPALHSPAFVASVCHPLGIDVGGPDVRFVRAASYEFHSLLAPQWRTGGVFLAGDACHVMPPFLGQGLNQGLRDCAALWWRLALVIRGIAAPDLLDGYERDRRPVAQRAVETSVAVGKLAEALSHGAAAPPKDNVVSRFYAAPASLPALAREGDALAGGVFPQWDERSDDAWFDASRAFFCFAANGGGQALRARVEALGGCVAALPARANVAAEVVMVAPDRFVIASGREADADALLVVVRDALRLRPPLSTPPPPSTASRL